MPQNHRPRRVAQPHCCRPVVAIRCDQRLNDHLQRPRRGNHEPARSIVRVPRIVTGVTGTPACAAATNAPIRKSSKPGVRLNVPSGKKPSDCPFCGPLQPSCTPHPRCAAHRTAQRTTCQSAPAACQPRDYSAVPAWPRNENAGESPPSVHRRRDSWSGWRPECRDPPANVPGRAPLSDVPVNCASSNVCNAAQRPAPFPFWQGHDPQPGQSEPAIQTSSKHNQQTSLAQAAPYFPCLRPTTGQRNSHQLQP
jgi:hypothetical protein